MNDTNGNGHGVGLQDAASQLGVSDRTLRRYIQRLGISPEQVYTQVGRAYRLAPADVDRIAADLAARGRTGAASGQVSASPSGAVIEGSGQPADKLTATCPERAATCPPGAVTLPALPGDALQQLAETIRQAVAQGVLDGLRQGQGRGKASRWLHGIAYTLLGLTLAACFGAALMLAHRIAEFTAG